MNYLGMPLGMRLLFKGSFQKNMTAVLGVDKRTAAEVTARAKPKYKGSTPWPPAGRTATAGTTKRKAVYHEGRYAVIFIRDLCTWDLRHCKRILFYCKIALQKAPETREDP